MQTRPTTKQPSTLTAKQLHFLQLVYKFRFVTAKLLADCSSTNRANSLRCLKRLLAAGYLTQDFSPEYRLLGKGARYSLSPAGVTYLKRTRQLNSKVLDGMYTNKSRGEEFIEHKLAVVDAYIRLRNSYSDSLQILTQSEFAGYSWLVNKKPDLYMRSAPNQDNIKREYLVELLEKDYFFVYEARVKHYLRNFLSESWCTDSREYYPDILFVCPTRALEGRLHEYIEKLLGSAGVDELTFSTTLSNLLTSEDEKDVWMHVGGANTRTNLGN